MRSKGVLNTAIVTPDKHFPYHDIPAINCLVKCIEIVKPSIYIDSGDNYARFISQAGSEMNGEDTYLGGGANNRYIICGLQMIV